MTDMPQQPTQTKGRLRHTPLVVILVVAILGAFTLGDYLSFDTLRDNRDLLLAYRDSHFLAMTLAFCAIYIVIVAFSLPGAAVASVTGGFLFGLALGTVLNVISASIGAILIFLAARWGLGADMAKRLDDSQGAAKRIKDGLHRNEISVLLLMRLVPVVPFFVANLLPALVGVRLGNFIWTTLVGIIPGGLVFTWIGVGLGDVFDRGAAPDLSLLWEPHILGPIIGLCVLAALPMVIRSIRGKSDI